MSCHHHLWAFLVLVVMDWAVAASTVPGVPGPGEALSPSSLDEDLHKLQARVLDVTRAIKIPTQHEIVQALNPHVDRLLSICNFTMGQLWSTPSSMEWIFNSRTDTATACAAVDVVRGLLQSQSHLQCWIGSAIVSQMPSSLLKTAFDHVPDIPTVTCPSLLALVFQSSLSKPFHVYTTIYERLMPKIKPQSDALTLFYDQVVLAAAHGPNPKQDVLIQRWMIWAQLLQLVPADAVKALARRQVGVLAPTTWAWLFYGLVQRLVPSRQRKRPWGEDADNNDCGMLRIWDDIFHDLVLSNDDDVGRYDRALLVQFAVRAPWTPEQFVTALEQRQFAWDELGQYRPFGLFGKPIHDGCKDLISHINVLFKSDIITRADVVHGLHDRHLIYLVRGLIRLSVVPVTLGSIGSLPDCCYLLTMYIRSESLSMDSSSECDSDLQDLYGELHFTIMSCPDGMIPYVELSIYDKKLISIILHKWISKDGRLESFISDLTSDTNDASWRIFFYLSRFTYDMKHNSSPNSALQHGSTSSSWSSPLTTILHRIMARVGRTEITLHQIKYLRGTSNEIFGLARALCPSPEERFEWDRIFATLIASPVIKARLAKSRSEPHLVHLLFVAYWHQSPEQQSRIELDPSLTRIVFPSWLSSDTVGLGPIDRDEVCVICQERLITDQILDDQAEDQQVAPVLNLVRLRCGHLYHQRCAAGLIAFKQIYSTQSKCALCNRSIFSRT